VFHIHQLGIVHYDIKNLNILFHSQTETLKLIDFEYAEFHPLGSTWFGIGKGTREYMAPEVLCGTICRHNLDMWSVGVTLLALVQSGKPSLLCSDFGCNWCRLLGFVWDES
jgi:serine/threonine protein kinase